MGAIAAVGLAGLAAACSSSSSTVSGTEHVYGKVTGKALESNVTKIPLTWTGPVNATGSISLSGPAPTKGQEHTFTTSKGNLVVMVTANPVNTATILSAKTCLAATTTTVAYTPLGSKSTGGFKGATGSGKVVVTFQAETELKGKCSTANNAEPVSLTGAYGEFAGGGPLTVPSGSLSAFRAADVTASQWALVHVAHPQRSP